MMQFYLMEGVVGLTRPMHVPAKLGVSSSRFIIRRSIPCKSRDFRRHNVLLAQAQQVPPLHLFGLMLVRLLFKFQVSLFGSVPLSPQLSYVTQIWVWGVGRWYGS